MENNNASEAGRIAQEAIRNITELSQLVSAGSNSGNETNFSAPATAWCQCLLELINDPQMDVLGQMKDHTIIINCVVINYAYMQ